VALGPVIQPLADPSTRSADGSVEVVVRNVEQRLIAEITSATIVVGCVAWLTSGPILDALARTQGVSIVVQKGGLPSARPRRTWTR
jgi:hypothetical protein